MSKRRLLFSLVPFSILTAILAIGSTGGVTGCGGDGTGGGDGCFDYGSFDGKAAVSFQTDVLPIFRQSCGLSTSCHGTETNPPKEQHFLGPPKKLGEATAAQIQAIFDQVVDKPSVQNPDMMVVKSGQPENSFLMYKMDGVACPTLTCAKDSTCGTDMPPPSSDLLDADKRDIVRRWIKQGAKND